MKKALIILLILIIHHSNAQIVGFQWQNCFGGTEDEYIETKSPNNIVELEDGYFILFTTGSDDGDVQSGNHGGKDIWLIKTDRYGNLLWEKTYGGSRDEEAGSLVKKNKNFFYIHGITTSNDGDVQSGHQGGGDNWIIQIDSLGNIVWEQTYGGSGFEKMGKAILSEDGGLYVYTSTFSRDGDVTNHSGYYLDQWLYKIDSLGNFDWGKCFGGGGQNFAGDIKITSDGGLLLAGTLYEGMDYGVSGTPLFGDMDIWLIKLDSNMEIEWEYLYGGSGSDSNARFKETASGFIVCGVTDSNDGLVNERYGNGDIWIFYIDSEGNFLHSNVIGGSDLDFSKEVYLNPDSTITIIGGTFSQNHDVVGNHSWDENYSDIWYVVLNTLGEIQYQRCIGNQGEQAPVGVFQLNEGRFIISAYSNVLGYADIECPRPFPVFWNDIWLFEFLDCNQNPPIIPSQPIGQDTICTINTTKTIYTTQIANPQLEEIEWQLQPSEAGELTNLQDSVIIQWNNDYEGQVKLSVRSSNSCGESVYSEPKIIEVRSCVGIGEIYQRELKTYPNPAKTQITFDLPEITKESKLQIKDIFGISVAMLPLIKGQTQLVWDCSQISGGIYFYQTEVEGINYSGKILIQ